jgi:peptide/nickel transport system permease protein
MREYLFKRVIYAIITLFVIASILFILFRLVPGTPTALVLGPALEKEAQDRLRTLYGLDRPMMEQYVLYIKNLFTLQWGRSFSTSLPVFDMLTYRFWNTIGLMGIGIFLTIGFGIVGGSIAAWRRGSITDKTSFFFVLVVRSAPPFVTGLLLIAIMSYRLEILPSSGMYSPGMRPNTLFQKFLSIDFFKHVILPSLTITAYNLADIFLIMRTSMLEAVGSDYIELAKAKGLKETTVMLKHATRNALLGVVTMSALVIGFAVGGQAVVETVFSWPGMGKLMVDSVAKSDYPVAQGSFFLLAVLVTVLNLIVDIIYAYLDPRISYTENKNIT